MILFLFKGLMRDRQRSLFPIIIVSTGVFLTTLLYSWMTGIFNEMIDGNARFDTGHVKIVTRGYKKIARQLPNDLALLNINQLTASMQERYPQFAWAPRIKFGGLLDIPDENGETKTQGPTMGIALRLLDADQGDRRRLKIAQSIVEGRMPEKIGEIVVSDEFAKKLDVKVGETATLISATAKGSMAIHNFIVAGTVEFGIALLDRGSIIADIADIQYALDMDNSAGELLGFSKSNIFDAESCEALRDNFNQDFQAETGDLTPEMLTLKEQAGLGEYINYVQSAGLIIVFIFVFTMSIVLWNTSLMSGIRRFGEVGVRLAIGESKSHIYRTLLAESFLIGFIGSVIGILFGLGLSWYLQEVGFDISSKIKNSAIMINDVIRARISPASFYIGFFPGLLATMFGAAISGIAIFKRQTASLFKELEI